MKSVRVMALSFVILVVGWRYAPEAAPLSPTQGTRIVLTLTSEDSSSDQRATIALIDSMISDGRLRLIDRRDDPLVPDRVHERFQQSYQGLPVLGADIAVQRRNGQLISAFGIVYDGLAIDITPQHTVVQVTAMLAARGLSMLGSSAPMSILPTVDGSVTLVHLLRNEQSEVSFVSANDAAIVMEITQRQTQSAVGMATGTLGDSKKISTTSQGGTFVSQDALRPPALQTYDLQANTDRVNAVLRGQVTLAGADLGRKSDNVWTDGPIVDAHVHAGWVYDYYFKRFQRRGLDNNDVRIVSIVHPVRQQDYRTAPASALAFYLNAFYSTDCRCMVYGEGIPAGVLTAFPNGVRSFATALDVVGHELTHAVTDASSRLVYANESGALNEAFSDIMGTSIEFFHQPAGSGALKADYLMGEDLAPVGTGLMRSMSAPTDFAQPDHYWSRQYIGSASSDFDSGGVHVNSGIANNAFYLAIEGGTNRSSRLNVSGVGAANREQIEKAFYRAFTSMLSSTSTFYLARVATIQSARDLYGTGSAAERAISGAWDAVGVITPGAALTTQFTPRSVPASNVSCVAGGARPSFTFRASVSEFQRVGFTVSGFSILSYDSQQRLVGQDNFSATTFRTWFSECQPANIRIGAGATACATVCGHLGGRTSGYAIFLFSGVDDNGNPGLFNSDVLSMGLPARSETETPNSSPTYTKVEKP